jgi:hypothetical protein
VLVDGAGATFGIDVARPGTVAQPIDVTAGEASISGVFTLTGALDASGAGATIALLGEAATGAPGWINAGTVSVSGGASLLLGGDETAVDIGSIANQGGSIAFVAGTLDNAGQTLGVSDPSLTGLTLAGGTIAGGAIDVAAERFAVAGDAVSDNAALDNVAVLGPLTVGSAIILTLAGSTAVYAGAGSTAPGAITVGSTGLVDFDESATPTLINDVTLEGGNISWSAPLPGGALVTPPVTAVIAAGVDVTGDGRLFTTYTAGQTLTNFGTIDATASFGNYYLGIYGTSFTNQGAIDVGVRRGAEGGRDRWRQSRVDCGDGCRRMSALRGRVSAIRAPSLPMARSCGLAGVFSRRLGPPVIRRSPIAGASAIPAGRWCWMGISRRTGWGR